MIIDFHTHIFPEKVAMKVEAKVKEAFGAKVPFCGPMTIRGLLDYMERCGIGKAVTFCVAEKIQAVKPANDFVISVTDNQKIIGFGTILPDMEDAVGEVKRIKKKGIKGIKFHSLFQDICAYDEGLFTIYEEMGENMIALFHSGRDPGHPERPSRTTPHDIIRVKEHFPKLRIVAAHLGGLGMLDESEDWVIGTDIYVDISWSPDMKSLGPETLVRIVRKHGVEKVLFGTDYPTTTDPKDQIEWFMRLSFTDEEKEMILWRNATKLLGI